MSSGIYIEIGPWNSPKSVRGIPQNPSVVFPQIRPAFTSKWVRDDTQNRTIRWHQNVAGIVLDFFMKCARNKIATTTPPPSRNGAEKFQEWVRHLVRNEFEKVPGLSQFFSGIGSARRPGEIGRCSPFPSGMVVLAFPALRFGAFFSRNGAEKCPGMGPKNVQEWGRKNTGMGPQNVQE